jgi:hypothetical protein
MQEHYIERERETHTHTHTHTHTLTHTHTHTQANLSAAVEAIERGGVLLLHLGTPCNKVPDLAEQIDFTLEHTDQRRLAGVRCDHRHLGCFRFRLFCLLFLFCSSWKALFPDNLAHARTRWVLATEKEVAPDDGGCALRAWTTTAVFLGVGLVDRAWSNQDCAREREKERKREERVGERETRSRVRKHT